MNGHHLHRRTVLQYAGAGAAGALVGSTLIVDLARSLTPCGPPSRPG